MDGRDCVLVGAIEMSDAKYSCLRKRVARQKKNEGLL